MIELMRLGILRKFIKNPQMYRFLAVGIITNLLSLLFIAVLTSLFGIFYAYSVLISLEAFTFVSFFIHDKWTFSNVPISAKRIKRLVKYNIFSLSGFGLNESILIFLTTQVKIPYLISEAIAIVVTFFFNFIISKKITWKN